MQWKCRTLLLSSAGWLCSWTMASSTIFSLVMFMRSFSMHSLLLEIRKHRLPCARPRPTHTHTHTYVVNLCICVYTVCVWKCVRLLPRTCTIFTTLPTYSYIRTRLHCGISMPSSATDVAMSILLWSAFWSVLLKESKTPFLLVSVITAAQQHKHTQHMWSKHVTQMKTIVLFVNYCESNMIFT